MYLDGIFVSIFDELTDLDSVCPIKIWTYENKSVITLKTSIIGGATKQADFININLKER